MKKWISNSRKSQIGDNEDLYQKLTTDEMKTNKQRRKTAKQTYNALFNEA